VEVVAAANHGRRDTRTADAVRGHSVCRRCLRKRSSLARADWLVALESVLIGSLDRPDIFQARKHRTIRLGDNPATNPSKNPSRTVVAARHQCLDGPSHEEATREPGRVLSPAEASQLSSALTEIDSLESPGTKEIATMRGGFLRGACRLTRTADVL
jgi:hypothetical protein